MKAGSLSCDQGMARIIAAEQGEARVDGHPKNSIGNERPVGGIVAIEHDQPPGPAGICPIKPCATNGGEGKNGPRTCQHWFDALEGDVAIIIKCQFFWHEWCDQLVARPGFDQAFDIFRLVDIKQNARFICDEIVQLLSPIFVIGAIQKAFGLRLRDIIQVNLLDREPVMAVPV